MQNVATSLQQLFLALAQALAVVMQHPETPRAFVRQFKKDAQRINRLAGITAEYIAAHVNPAGIEPQAAYLQLGLALADVLERNDVPDDIWNWLGDATNEVENLLAPQEPLKREAARLRGMLTAYVGANAQTVPALASEYAPEIEARRADYQKLAECFAFMGELEMERAPSLLDVTGWIEDERHCLTRAFDTHWRVLCCELLESASRQTLLKFYAEMRCFADQLALERERAAEQHAA